MSTERKAETERGNGKERESGNGKESGNESGKGKENESGNEKRTRKGIEKKMKKMPMSGASWKGSYVKRKLLIKRYLWESHF